MSSTKKLPSSSRVAIKVTGEALWDRGEWKRTQIYKFRIFIVFKMPLKFLMWKGQILNQNKIFKVATLIFSRIVESCRF